MTPYQIEVCLWYYSRALDWEGMDAPIWPSVRDTFLSLGLLQQSHDINKSYEATPRLKAYVEGLMSMPLPTQSWTIPVYCPHPSLDKSDQQIAP
jgi:hypothetical protein